MNRRWLATLLASSVNKFVVLPCLCRCIQKALVALHQVHEHEAAEGGNHVKHYINDPVFDLLSREQQFIPGALERYAKEH